MDMVTPAWAMFTFLLLAFGAAALFCGVMLYVIVLRRPAGVVKSHDFAELRDEVARLREEVERLKRSLPAGGSTGIKATDVSRPASGDSV